MAYMQRSPSSKPAKSPIIASTLDQSRSVPDITKAVSDPDFVNLTARHKRPRVDDSSIDQLEEFKLEIKQMLTAWKRDHDDAIAKVMAEQTAIVTKLASDLAEVKLQNIQIQKTNADIEKSITCTSEMFDDMKKQVKELQEECRKYKKYSESMENTIRDLQYKSRSSSVEVRNIPIQPNESTADLVKIISCIGNNVDLPLTSTNIRDIYRVPGNSTNKAIVAELTSVQIKSELISRVRGFNHKHPNKDNKLNTQLIGLAGHKQPVYVDEHLCLSTKKLFYLARQFAKQHEYKFCWSANGNIFLRKQQDHKQILIRSETTLRDLLPQNQGKN